MRVTVLNKSRIIWIFLGIAFISSCEKNVDQTGFFTPDMVSIATFLEQNKEAYSVYYEMMQQSDLYYTLNAYNPDGVGYTLFLPGDDAFARYIEQNDNYPSLDALLEDEEFVYQLSRYHLVNRSIRSSEFPYGALPDSTATGDYLNISIDVSDDTTVYRVNNISPLVGLDIETNNGFIHLMDQVLEPITKTSYEWLFEEEGFSILSGLFEITGLKDTMGVYRYNESGSLVRNSYTVLAEPDSVFHRSGIMSLDELVEKYASPGLSLSDPDNLLYQFAAYHILEGSYFLDAFEGSGNYNSYAVYPVHVSSGFDIKINPGVDSFGYQISGSDTTLIDYINIFFQQSNENTRNGPIHFISQVMELYKPSLSERTFQFMEEPLIFLAEASGREVEFLDPTPFELIHWEGGERLLYAKLPGNVNLPLNGDYLNIEGNFTIRYKMPKVLPGLYRVELGVESNSDKNATVRVYVDGKRMGSNFDLTLGGTGNNPFVPLNIGTVEFSVYEAHEIVITTLIPGTLAWDFVRFIPEL